METSMLKVFAFATCLALGTVSAVIAKPVSIVPPVQDEVSQSGLVLNRLAANRLATNRLATNRLATNRLAQNRLAQNRLAQNGLPLAGISLAPSSAGDVTPLVTVVAVTLADGTRLEVPASR
jgi:hypothetical protein